MKALVFTDVEEIVYQDYDDPKIKKNESIIKVTASGICGSDMHAYHGKDERRVPPLILGHEISGVIYEGSNKGNKVIVNPLISCGKCDYCNRNSEHLCPERSLIGMNRPFVREGGLAEFVSVPKKNLNNLPKELDINKAALTEPTAVSLHAVELGEKNLQLPLDKAKVLIIGGGAIGILCALILQNIKKNLHTTLVEINEKRLNVCKKSLQSQVLNTESDKIKNNSFDLVIDAVGNEKTRQFAIKSTKPGGAIVHVGLTDAGGSFDFRKTTLQEITFIGTYCYTFRDFNKTIKILSESLIGDLNWIQYKDLKNGSEAFKQIHDGTCASPKIILIP